MPVASRGVMSVLAAHVEGPRPAACQPRTRRSGSLAESAMSGPRGHRVPRHSVDPRRPAPRVSPGAGGRVTCGAVARIMSCGAQDVRDWRSAGADRARVSGPCGRQMPRSLLPGNLGRTEPRRQRGQEGTRTQRTFEGGQHVDRDAYGAIPEVHHSCWDRHRRSRDRRLRVYADRGVSD